MTAADVVAIRNILVATDFSRCSDGAVRTALALARHFGARLHVLHVVGSVAERPTALDRLGAFAEAHIEGVPFTAAVAVGRTAPEIVRRAESEPVDLIVVGTHGRTGLAHAVMGSVAEAVVRTAPCQVLTIRLREGEQTAEATAHPAQTSAAESLPRRCLVCARPSDERICENCAALIRGEALERMLEDEKAGRR
jgi:nucleotide-binding universal stress UspA family protein